MKFNLDSLEKEFETLETELSNPEVFRDQKKVRELSSRKKQITLAVDLYKEYKNAYKSLNEAVDILYNEKDEDMRELAKMQKDESETSIEKLEEEIKVALLPKDNDDDKNIMLEVRAWTGWEEAALFAWELSKWYIIFAQNEWFKTEVVEETISETGWVREIIIEIKWDWAYKRFKYESWVHRVQRIPTTENKWRVHTSAITVL